MSLFNLGAYDALFAAGMVHAVAVDLDKNYAGAGADARGNVAPDWSPPALVDALPCRVTQMSTAVSFKDGKKTVVTTWSILYKGPPVLDARHRVRFTENGVTHYLVPNGRADDEGAVGHHRYCELTESV